MDEYVEVKSLGIKCYSDAFIGDRNTSALYFASLFGRPALVKAIGAAILEGQLVHFGDQPIYRMMAHPYRSITQALGNGVAHRVLFCEEYFMGNRARILIAEDKRRAFELLDTAVSTPLKEEWADKLWNMVFEPKRLDGFGSIEGKTLEEVYLVTLDKTVDEVDALVLESIKIGKLN